MPGARPGGASRAVPSPAARERRSAIRARVDDEGFVRIDALAEQFGVTIMTIHRDLDLLQSQGWLRKVRGGATAQPSALHHGDIRHRAQAAPAAKAALARHAAAMVHPGASVLLDESTTGLALAPLLPERGPLTVISNFLAVTNLLAGEPGIDLICLGGEYYPAYDAFLGVRTSDAARSLGADLLFASTTAVTGPDCFHQSLETVAVKRALMAAAERSVLLVDHTKFGRRGLHRMAPLDAFDLVVVDSGVDEAVLTALRRSRVRVEVAQVAEPAQDASAP